MNSLTQRVMIDHWCTALNDPELAKLVRREKPKNLQQAYKSALAIEVIERTAPVSAEPARMRRTAADRFACTTDELPATEVADIDDECNGVFGLQPRRSVIPSPQEKYLQREVTSTQD